MADRRSQIIKETLEMLRDSGITFTGSREAVSRLLRETDMTTYEIREAMGLNGLL